MFEANVNKFFSMKKLVNLKGVKALGKAQQKSIFGGCGEEVECEGSGGSGGGGEVYCGCSHGDNVWASDCSAYTCNDACNSNGNGYWTGACMV